MDPETRVSIDDDFVRGLSCAICGAQALRVVHLREYPDFVSCAQCQSAFVVEHGGTRVMYGKIADTLPFARDSLLHQWKSLDEVRRMVASKRVRAEAPTLPSAPPQEETETAATATPSGEAALPSSAKQPPEEQVPVVIPTVDAEEAELPTPGFPGSDVPSMQAILSDLVAESQEPLGGPPIIPSKQPEEPRGPIDEPAVQQAATIPLPPLPPEQRAAEEEAAEAPAPEQAVTASPPSTPPEQPTPEEPSAPAEGKIPTGDPPAGQRWRVVIRGGQLRMPRHICAHCLSSPVHGALHFPLLLPVGQTGRRKKSAVDVPVCAQCQKRSNARSRERRDALTLAHLLSAMAALLLVVAAVWLDLADFSRSLGFALLVLAGLALAGYLIPLALLLPWASRFQPPRDAAFVASTLRLPQAGTEEGNETAFEWRNPAFAVVFAEANRSSFVSGPDLVRETETPASQQP